jgi:hypothetical protein
MLPVPPRDERNEIPDTVRRVPVLEPADAGPDGWEVFRAALTTMLVGNLLAAAAVLLLFGQFSGGDIWGTSRDENSRVTLLVALAGLAALVLMTAAQFQACRVPYFPWSAALTVARMTALATATVVGTFLVLALMEQEAWLYNELIRRPREIRDQPHWWITDWTKPPPWSEFVLDNAWRLTWGLAVLALVCWLALLVRVAHLARRKVLAAAISAYTAAVLLALAADYALREPYGPVVPGHHYIVAARAAVMDGPELLFVCWPAGLLPAHSNKTLEAFIAALLLAVHAALVFRVRLATYRAPLRLAAVRTAEVPRDWRWPEDD